MRILAITVTAAAMVTYKNIGDPLSFLYKKDLITNTSTKLG
jgi:hypothetical protein